MARRRAKPIAPEEYNTITLATVALGTVSTTAPDLENSVRPFDISFAPVRGAYVICEQVSHERLRPAPLIPFQLRIGRTTASGWVLEREEHDIHDDPTAAACEEESGFAMQQPPPAKERMLLDASEQHAMYWCYGRENFERMYDAFVLQPDAARKQYEACLIYPEFRGPGDDFLKGVRNLNEPFRREAAEYLSRDAEYHTRRPKCDPAAEVWVYDVTPKPLRTLFRVELAHWYQVQAVKAAAPAMASLSRARELIRAAYKGLPDVELDRRFPAQPGTPERYVLDHYRDFVWQCAANGVRWDLVSRAVSVTARESWTWEDVRTSQWFEGAERISQMTGRKAVHPVFRRIERHKLYVDVTARKVLEEYHQAYMLGAELRGCGLDKRLDQALLDLEHGLAQLRQAACDALTNGAPHVDLMEAVGTRHEPADALQCDLVRRHLSLAATLRYEWWAPLRAFKADQWTAFLARLKWVGGIPQGFAKMFKSFYEEGLKRYEIEIDEANDVLSTLVRHTFAATGQQPEGVFDSSLPTRRATAHVDFDAQTIDVVASGSAKTQKLELLFAQKDPPRPEAKTSKYDDEELEMLDAMKVKRPLPHYDREELEMLAAANIERPASNMQETRWLTAHRLRAEPLEVEVEEPLDLQRMRRNGVTLPDFVSKALGSANTALGLYDALLKLRSGGAGSPTSAVEAWYALGRSTLGAIDSAAVIQSVLLSEAAEDADKRLLARLKKATKGASKVVSLVDAGVTLASGIRTLTSDDGEIAYELRHHRRARAELLEAKAVLQIATATAGAAMAVESLIVLGGAASAGVLTAVSGPVGFLIVCGELLIAVLDARLDLTAPFEAAYAQLEAEFDAANRTLFTSEKTVRFIVAEEIERVLAATC